MGDTVTAPVTVIQPSRGWRALGLHEVWEYRDLLYFLVWRQVKGRYRQMALGPLWVILHPLMSMVVFTVIFGKVARIPTDNLPGPLFYYSGLLPWVLFSGAANGAATSLVSNMNLISKVYFPRLIIPLSAALGGLIDFCFSLVVLVGMMLAFGYTPQITIILLPFYLALALATALAIGLWLAALAVKFRDVSFGINYFIQLLLYACPVIYPMSSIPARWATIYKLNPMAHVVEGCRWAIFGAVRVGESEGTAATQIVGHPPEPMLAVAAALVFLALISGAYHFRRTERTIVDLL